MLNEIERTEIETRLNAATTAPWVTDLHQGLWSVYCGEIDHYHPVAIIKQNQNQENNAKFIAHSRTDIIKCLNEIDRLNEVIRQFTKSSPIEGGWN